MRIGAKELIAHDGEILQKFVPKAMASLFVGAAGKTGGYMRQRLLGATNTTN